MGLRPTAKPAATCVQARLATDRASYAFAIVSVAAALKVDNGIIQEVRLALGGVAHKPKRYPIQDGVFRFVEGDTIRTMPTLRVFLKLAPCALLFFSSRMLFAEDARKLLGGDLAKHWQILKGLSLGVADAITENAYTPKASLSESEPSEAGPLELGALALETVLSCSIALGTPAPTRFQSALNRPRDSTKTGVITDLTAAYDFCIDGLNQTNDTDLFKTSARGYKGHPATKFDIFWDAFAHATHRLGKAEMYLRLKGITPPDVGPKFDF